MGYRRHSPPHPGLGSGEVPGMEWSSVLLTQVWGRLLCSPGSGVLPLKVQPLHFPLKGNASVTFSSWGWGPASGPWVSQYQCWAMSGCTNEHGRGPLMAVLDTLQLPRDQGWKWNSDNKTGGWACVCVCWVEGGGCSFREGGHYASSHKVEEVWTSDDQVVHGNGSSAEQST